MFALGKRRIRLKLPRISLCIKNGNGMSSKLGRILNSGLFKLEAKQSDVVFVSFRVLSAFSKNIMRQYNLQFQLPLQTRDTFYRSFTCSKRVYQVASFGPKDIQSICSLFCNNRNNDRNRPIA